MKQYSKSGKGHYDDEGEKVRTFEKGIRKEIKKVNQKETLYGGEYNVHGKGRVVEKMLIANGEINAESNAFTLRADDGGAAKFFSTKAGVMGGVTCGIPTSAGYNFNADVVKAS